MSDGSRSDIQSFSDISSELGSVGHIENVIEAQPTQEELDEETMEYEAVVSKRHIDTWLGSQYWEPTDETLG